MGDISVDVFGRHAAVKGQRVSARYQEDVLAAEALEEGPGVSRFRSIDASGRAGLAGFWIALKVLGHRELISRRRKGTRLVARLPILAGEAVRRAGS